MNYLGLDIGERHTGVSYGDDETRVAVALNTLHHSSSEELIGQVEHVCTERSATALVIGLPYLPSGKEGAQAAFVRSCADLLMAKGWEIHFVDERYTTPRNSHGDPDSAAACLILQQFFDRIKY